MKKIQGFEDYKIDEHGNVVSTKYGEERKRKWCFMSNGYPFVKLRSNGNGSCQSIHRLVAITFIPNPENKPQVNHIDGNKLNNHVSNLEWCTMGENNLHAYRTGLKKHHRCWLGKNGENHNKSIKVLVIFPDGKEKLFGSIREAARELNIPFGSIYSFIKKGKSENGTIFKKITK